VTVLRGFPRWLRVALLVVNLAAALAVLVNWWLAIWPNLAAAWVQFAVIAALAIPLGAWLGRLMDARHAAHHDGTRAHVETALAAHAEAQNQRLDALGEQVASLHERLNQTGGTP
jgi:hypothetical protein